jgi:hypothetical protein
MEKVQFTIKEIKERDIVDQANLFITFGKLEWK